MATEIVIVGYGRMGKEIEQQARQLGLTVTGIADNHTDLQQLAERGQIGPGRVAIEFTGAAAVSNLSFLLGRDMPVVCGSTPWEEATHRSALELCRQRRGYLLFSSNYSIGVQLFWRLVRQAGKLLNRFPQYDVALSEQHHKQKVDSPSGTAMATAKILLQELERKTTLLCGNPQNQRPIAAEELQISSQRLGQIAGVHQLLCESPEDSIAITHSAHSRAGFARGALLAAQFLAQQARCGKSGFFDMEDLMDSLIDHPRTST